MEVKRTLSLDIGGTAVKAALFENDQPVKSGSWRHDYRDSPQEQAKDHLLREARDFSGGSVDAVGLSVAGLIAEDGTLFRSTVLTSLEGFPLGEFLKDQLRAGAVSIDNDADCGGVGEHFFAQHELFYVVIGSGIGSAYIDDKGGIKYLVRINRSLPYSDEMNHPISDIGLKILIPKEQICDVFKEHQIPRETVDRILVPQNRSDGKGLTEEGAAIRLGRLGSATGVHTLLEILWRGQFQEPTVQRYYEEFIATRGLQQRIALTDLYDYRQAAKPIALLAGAGEDFAIKAYRLMGIFLGTAISKAQEILFHDLGRSPAVHLGGQILAAGDLFIREVRGAAAESGRDCRIDIGHAFKRGHNPNLWGAYMCVNQRGSEAETAMTPRASAAPLARP